MSLANWLSCFAVASVCASGLCQQTTTPTEGAPATIAEQNKQNGLPANGPTATFAAVTGARDLTNGVEVVSGKAILRITALRDDVLRIRGGATGTLPEDASWAVPADVRGGSVPVEPLDSSASVGFRTKTLDVRIERDPMRLVIRDLGGRIISADALGHAAAYENGSFRVWKTLPRAEHFFGLGDKVGPLDRRGQAFSMWNTDAFGFQEATDPIYKTIPFFLAINEGVSYGIFWITPGGRRSTLAKRSGWHTRSAPKAARSTTTSSMGRSRSRSSRPMLI